MRLIFLFLIALFIKQSGFCQSEKDSIDIMFDVCLDTSFSSYDMLMCKEEAWDHWNEKLNVMYSNLLHQTDSIHKVHLINSQEAWSAYFDSEISLWESCNDPYNNNPAAWDYDRYDRMIILVRNRVSILRSLAIYLDRE